MMGRDGRKGGFSLLEALLAVLILGVGITGMAEGITAGLRTSKDAERRTAAALLASGRLEEIRAEGLVIEGESDIVLEGPLSIYSLHEMISRTPMDGLFEASVTVLLASTNEPLFELKTLLFDREAPVSTAGASGISHPPAGRPARSGMR